MKCNEPVVIHTVLHESIVCDWNLSVLKAVNSVPHVSGYLKGQPFTVSAIINLALWLPWQARHQDYNSISITHPKAPNSLLHKAESTLLSSALQSQEIWVGRGGCQSILKRSQQPAVTLHHFDKLQLPSLGFLHHPREQIQIFPLKTQIITNSSALHLKKTIRDNVFTAGESGYLSNPQCFYMFTSLL